MRRWVVLGAALIAAGSVVGGRLAGGSSAEGVDLARSQGAGTVCAPVVGEPVTLDGGPGDGPSEPLRLTEGNWFYRLEMTSVRDEGLANASVDLVTVGGDGAIAMALELLDPGETVTIDDWFPVSSAVTAVVMAEGEVTWELTLSPAPIGADDPATPA